jgi:hypothetical protein
MLGVWWVVVGRFVARRWYEYDYDYEYEYCSRTKIE